MEDERLKRASELEAEAERLRESFKNNPPVTHRVAYMIEDAPGQYRVGCKDDPQVGNFPYNGPCAHIYSDKSFVYVCTDDYEGNAMVNIEALGPLIEALSKLREHIASHPVSE